jgi:hypothetical protein
MPVLPAAAVTTAASAAAENRVERTTVKSLPWSKRMDQ